MSSKSAVSFRTTYFLIGGAALLLAALAIYVFTSDEDTNQEGVLLSGFHRLSTKSSDVTGLEIDSAGQKIVFSRQPDGRWFIVQPIKARADSTLVENIVHQLLTAKREEKNVDILDNLGAHGLDNPPVKITVRRGDRTATLSLGKVSVGSDQAVVYVLTSDQPKKAQATLKKRLSALFKDKAPDSADAAAHLRNIDDFRTRKLLGEDIEPEAAPTQLLGVRLKVGKNEVHISRNNPDKVWRFVKPEGFGDVETLKPGDKDFNPVKFQYLNYLLNTILAIEVPSPKEFLAGAQDLTVLGLDPSNPDVLQVELERNDPIGTEKIWISRVNAKKELDKVYVRYGDEETVAMVNGEKPRLLWNLVRDPSDLRDLTLVKLRPDRVDAIDVIQGGKKSFELRKVAGRWKVFEGNKVNEADPKAIGDLLMLLSQPRAVRGFPAPGTTDEVMGFDKPDAELHIWEDGIITSKAEKEDAGMKPKVVETPTTRVVFGKPEIGDVVFVRRAVAAGKVDAKISATVKNYALRDRLQYVSVILKPFALGDVTRVVIPRGKEVYEIERGVGGQWTIVAPESKKGKLANADKIQSLLQALALMQPQKVRAESPTIDQLKPLGLDPKEPVQKLAVRIKGEPADRVWYFGHPVSMAESIYAKSSEADFVLEVSKQYLDIASKGELIDPHLYQISAPQVEGIKLKGWADVVGAPFEIALTRKTGGLWEAAKKETAFTSERVEALLGLLVNPQAETIVAEKGMPAEQHGLDIAKGALEFTIDIGGGRKHILVLGNIVSKESKLMYALYNGDIVTIKAEPLLLDVKAKPTGLR